VGRNATPKRTLFDLASNLRKRAKGVDRKASEVSKAVALEVVKVLVMSTPVDTSRALSNWQVGVGKPVNTPLKPYVPGEQGSTRSQSAMAAIAKAELFLSSKKPGEPIFISNVLDYIDDLNNGTISRQPGGFVEKALIIAENRVNAAKVRI